MAVATIDHASGYPDPPEPELTPAQVVARAAAIAPTLVDRQVETERRTYYAEDTHEEFRQAGFYRILVPRRYGGYEFGLDTFLRVATALARGCPSTGWMFALGAAHALPVATLFGERAQAELFAGGDFICPATVAPGGTAGRADDGSWVVNGTWPYCSGAPYATHYLAHTLVGQGEDLPPAPMMFIVPRAQWQRQDDWGGQLGLRGSGSHSIVVQNARIPDHFTVPGHISLVQVSADLPGRQLHVNPQYGGAPLSAMLFVTAAVAVGMAQGALDAYESLLRTRKTSFLPVVSRFEDPDYQHWYGEAAGKIATAEAAILNAAQQWRDTCAGDPADFTRERDLQLATICREVTRLAWHAVEGNLFPTAGSSAVRHGERIERVWRDMSMIHSHAGFAVFLATMANREFARARFNLP